MGGGGYGRRELALHKISNEIERLERAHHGNLGDRPLDKQEGSVRELRSLGLGAEVGDQTALLEFVFANDLPGAGLRIAELGQGIEEGAASVVPLLEPLTDMVDEGQDSSVGLPVDVDGVRELREPVVIASFEVGDDEVELAREVVVEAGLRDAGFPDDLVDSRGLVTLFVEEANRYFENAFPWIALERRVLWCQALCFLTLCFLALWRGSGALGAHRVIIGRLVCLSMVASQFSRGDWARP